MSKIRDYVDIQDHPTVVRLEDSLEESWISSSYYLTEDVQLHVDALRKILAGDVGTGVFLVGSYGSGKSHFLAWLTQRLRAGELLDGPAPDVVAISLLNYNAEARLEDVVCSALDIYVGTEDRRVGWDAAMARHPAGLLLVIDELSEFLRSKPAPQRYTEDIRFLQFMGEWSMGHRFTVLGAMQEAIEHTGDLEHALYRKIKDRFPLRFRLTPTHVHDLIANHVLVKKPGYDEAVRKLTRHLAAALPDARLPFDKLSEIYPLHPATLELLDEVRDRFSQTRGVIDFVCTQLSGKPEREISPFLDREWGELVTPNVIVDHFEDVLQLQPEFLPVAQRLLPWYERHLPELFDTPGQRRLAERLIRLLVVAHLSPSREGLTAEDASLWLLFAATRIDPSRNLMIVKRVLETLAREGRFVRAVNGRFSLDLKDDGASQLERMLQRELAELPGAESLLESLARALGGKIAGRQAFNPLLLPRDRWQERTVKWCNHERPWSVFLGNGEPPPTAEPALCIRLPWGETTPAPGCHTVQPKQIQMTPALRELAAMIRLRTRPLNPDVTRLLSRRIEDRLPLFAAELRAAYGGAPLILPEGRDERGPAFGPSDTLEDWLDGLALRMLQRRFPAFEKHAPSHGPLPQEAYRAFARFVTEKDIGGEHADDWVSLVREAYLVPMGLLRRQGRRYTVPAGLDNNDLVRRLLPLVERSATVEAVYEHLSAPIFGLVDDQIHLLLIFLFVLGEIDILKGKRSYRETYETLPKPRKYDRIVIGRALSQEQLQTLERLCDGLHLKKPRQWTVHAQRRAVAALESSLETHVRRFEQVSARLEEGSELQNRLEQFISWCAALQQGDDDLEGFEQFLYVIESPTLFLARLAELVDVPTRIDKQVLELRHYEHLFRQPGLAELLAELGQPPGLEEGEALETWIKRARAAHEEYGKQYRKQHDAWWRELADHPGWSWKPPTVARSRHVGLASKLRELATVRDSARRARCLRLSDLSFQSRCSCGFDGETGPAAELLATMTTQADEIEQELRLFFRQPSVRKALRQWVDQGVEVTEGAQAYLAEREPWPEVLDLDTFDEHLSGVDVVKSADASPILKLLSDRTWETPALRRALNAHIDGLGAERVRFETSTPFDEDGVAEWCLRQALRFGVTLPRGLGDTSRLAEGFTSENVGTEALSRLEELGLDPRSLERVLGFVVNGRVQPGAEPAGLVAAAQELVEPTRPDDPERLARLAEALYRAHPLMANIASERWLQRLEELAATPLSEPLEPIAELLSRQLDATWVIIDAFGLPLLEPVRSRLDQLLPGWEVARTEFVQNDGETTTDGFYQQLVAAGLNHPIEKIDVVDTLLHGRNPTFEDLCALALAELRVSLGDLRRRLDRARQVVVLGDHGFRYAADGRAWTHGGTSTLERAVPVLVLSSL